MTVARAQFRYTLLTLAALEAPLVLPLGEDGLYGQDVVFFANDWWVMMRKLVIGLLCFRSIILRAGARASVCTLAVRPGRGVLCQRLVRLSGVIESAALWAARHAHAVPEL